jgi:hypothetical protein
MLRCQRCDASAEAACLPAVGCCVDKQVQGRRARAAAPKVRVAPKGRRVTHLPACGAGRRRLRGLYKKRSRAGRLHSAPGIRWPARKLHQKCDTLSKSAQPHAAAQCPAAVNPAVPSRTLPCRPQACSGLSCPVSPRGLELLERHCLAADTCGICCFLFTPAGQLARRRRAPAALHAPPQPAPRLRRRQPAPPPPSRPAPAAAEQAARVLQYTQGA